ncbi:MAG: HD-GYP domain-containing protein [Synergistetes bacterium]|nr:HD-GYP domain-containing protein [Synergistota bacterium]MCX8127392.1 HD-GYP domain-containing protein [Synergistota bacterium]MDW8192256.1 HD-GYP domain-containing protein [Synergistota bacterium]
MKVRIKKSILDLQPGDVIGVDVFAPGKARVLLVPKGWKIESEEECENLKVKLAKFGIEDVVIESAELEEGIPSIANIREKALSLFPVISEEARSRALDAVKRVAILGRIDMREIEEAVDRIVDEVVEKREVVFSLYALRNYDDYTFVHSVNVAMLTALFGLDFNYSRDEIRVLTKGAILHDLGKLKISNSIINKPGPLTPEEFVEIKKHPIYGVEMTLSSGETNEDILSIIAQHHEWFSGKGYPRGLTGEKISFMARIVSVIDVFDALTTDRAYKPKMLSYEAVSKMLHEGAAHFDPRILSKFITRFGIYPLGSLVKLSDGRIGVVSKINPISPIRPVVKILYDEFGLERSEPDEVDLFTSDVFITEVLDDLSKSLLYK